MTDKERLELAHWVIKLAQKQGAEEVKVSIGQGRDVEVEFRDNQLEKLQESSSKSLSMNLYIEHRFSSHSTNDLRKDALAKFVENTVAMTRYLSADPFRSLPDAQLYANRPQVDLQIYDAGQPKVDSKDRVKFAQQIEAAARAQSNKIISSTAGYSDGVSENTTVTSNGFEGSTLSTYYSTGAEVTVQDENGGRPEDWFYIVSRFRQDLLNPEEIGKRAAGRALSKIGMKKITSRKCTMLVENRAAGQLIRYLLGPLSARSIQQKQSFLENMLNQPVAADILTIIDNPFIPKGFGSRLFDGEGISARKMPVIEKGILKNYYVDTYYGKKLEMAPTFGGSSNLELSLGTRGLEAMIAATENGILITSFLGGNSNSTTGDYSFGLQGVLIENGKQVHPVNEMNISGNLKDTFLALSEIGNDPYPYSSLQCPTLRFEAVDFSGI